jgi:phospholipase/carboxylesterase
MHYTPPLIIEPAHTANKTIIWCHGLGSNGHDLSGLITRLKVTLPNVNIRHIFPHAPKRPITINQNYVMPGWYDIYSFDRYNAKQDEAGIKESSRYLNQLIEQEIAKGLNYKDIVLAGFSQGGAISLYAGIYHYPTLGGIMALSSYLPLHKQILNNDVVKNKDIPLFLAIGVNDQVVRPELSNHTFEFFKNNNFKNITLKEYPMAHEVCLSEIKDIGEWLSKIFA